MRTKVYNDVEFRFDKLFVCKFVYIIPVRIGFVNHQITVSVINFVSYPTPQQIRRIKKLAARAASFFGQSK